MILGHTPVIDTQSPAHSPSPTWVVPYFKGLARSVSDYKLRFRCCHFALNLCLMSVWSGSHPVYIRQSIKPTIGDGLHQTSLELHYKNKTILTCLMLTTRASLAVGRDNHEWQYSLTVMAQKRWTWKYKSLMMMKKLIHHLKGLY